MLDEADDNIDQFLTITGTTDRDVAMQYLQMAGGDDNNLEVAVSLFLEVGDDQQEIVADSGTTADIGIDAANDEDIPKDDDNESNLLSEPDYDYLAEDDNENNRTFDTLCKEIIGESRGEEDDDNIQQQHADDDIDISPDYYDNLGLDCAELSATAFDEFAPIEKKQEEEDNMKAQSNKEEDEQYNFYTEEVLDDGEEYILGTLMVRVLQAKNVKSNPNNQGGNMIANLLSSHRRNRHQQRPTMSPASAIASGNLTPYSNQQLYAKLTYNNQGQLTSNALEHMNGDYHWSRSDQSYFDVTCSAFPLRMGEKKMMHHQQPPRPLTKTQASSAPTLTTQKDDVSCGGSKPNNNEIPQPITKPEKKRQCPPILQLSLYSKNTHGTNHKQKGSSWPFQNEKDVEEVNDDDYLIGKCSINIQRILSGKTPYFDEWIDIQSNNQNNNNEDESSAGRVRIVIEYESTDPPPRPGDMCTFANTHLIEDELYPIPLYSIKKTVQPLIARSSMSMSTLPSASSTRKPPAKYTTKLARYPKTFRVEEVVGDIVILSYTTPIENWQCTFEVHRYLLLCVERHQAIVEKFKEQTLDLFDNLSQSPALEQISKTVETLPDEGLVYVGAGVLEESVNLLGRWWETGVEGMVEDVVNGTNLDGRYSHLSDDEEEVNDEPMNGVHNQLQDMTLDESETASRQALPGMPCCPITGLPMIEPVVCADGHTYERHAISRWLLSSNRSPLTGAILAHTELVPNYLLISSLGSSQSSVQEEENVILEEHPGLLDVL